MSAVFWAPLTGTLLALETPFRKDIGGRSSPPRVWIFGADLFAFGMAWSSPIGNRHLKDSKKFKLHKGVDGKYVLWVYQTKLVSVPPRYRWKLIPLFIKQQKELRDIIVSGEFQRPLVKTFKRYFGQHTTLYGGRKGFTDLMLSLGQDFINISQWMGHAFIDRT